PRRHLGGGHLGDHHLAPTCARVDADDHRGDGTGVTEVAGKRSLIEIEGHRQERLAGGVGGPARLPPESTGGGEGGAPQAIAHGTPPGGAGGGPPPEQLATREVEDIGGGVVPSTP